MGDTSVGVGETGETGVGVSETGARVGETGSFGSQTTTH